MIGVPEFRASFHEADFSDGKAQVMEPLGICAGWDQADRRHASLALIQRPRHPLRDILAVGWIHPADAFPWLFQPVVGLGVVFWTLGVFIRRGHVHRESELAVERVEDIGGCCPFHGVAFESGVEVGHNMKRKMENKAFNATAQLYGLQAKLLLHDTLGGFRGWGWFIQVAYAFFLARYSRMYSRM